ncbi:MAG: hypothetical protein FD123_729 [Bacteroidetes bacterium]|nr:MAG: hypothetical protein FD123_729 [Bacteroidota bacterium]
MKKLILSLSLFAGISSAIAQEDIKLPEASQEASLSQRIGLTDIKVSYHSPLVRGRKIWGELVPYGEVWRAGANENTTISFSTDVSLEGKKLPAGIYGVHMIPTAGDWTIIISKNYYSWGSFFYKQEQDAMRFTVKPQETPMQEWMSYTFDDLQKNAAVLSLRWEKLRIPIKVTVDVTQTVVEDIRRQLDNIPGFFPDAYYTAAAYCYRNNVNQAEAAKWLDRSIRDKPTFANLKLKSEQLEKEGKKAEADALVKKALTLADENGLNTYGYALLGEGKKQEALDIFRQNAKKYPDSWNVYDSLAETLELMGNKKEALANYQLARKKAPEAQHARLDSTIARLQGKS